MILHYDSAMTAANCAVAVLHGAGLDMDKAQQIGIQMLGKVADGHDAVSAAVLDGGNGYYVNLEYATLTAEFYSGNASAVVTLERATGNGYDVHILS